jgi:hypothetical protein
MGRAWTVWKATISPSPASSGWDKAAAVGKRGSAEGEISSRRPQHRQISRSDSLRCRSRHPNRVRDGRQRHGRPADDHRVDRSLWPWEVSPPAFLHFGYEVRARTGGFGGFGVFGGPFPCRGSTRTQHGRGSRPRRVANSPSADPREPHRVTAVGCGAPSKYPLHSSKFLIVLPSPPELSILCKTISKPSRTVVHSSPRHETNLNSLKWLAMLFGDAHDDALQDPEWPAPRSGNV